MGKNNRHKKFLKQEKSKIKLKSGKKLPKGQNITDTSFKVKQIVLRDQLTANAEAEPQTKKKLNLKDLLSRVHHYNVNMRQDAVSGLRELVVVHPEVLCSSLCTLIEHNAALCVDKEPNVRKEALRLLQSILAKVDAVQLEPFLPILVSYLSMGLSHLHREIQEDGLKMLDAVLEAAPSLVARAAPSLLPAFLDQISVRRNTESVDRTLSVDLKSSNTSSRWRIKVLGRLHAMLSAASSATPSSNTTYEAPLYHYTSTASLHAPVYMSQHAQVCTIQGLFNSGANVLKGQQLFKDETQLKNYIQVLMPLLFETWIEVGPSEKKQEQGSVITSEAAELLECIMEVIQHIWDYLCACELEVDYQTLTKWFKNSFRKDFTRHIMTHFPFLTMEDNSTKKKARKSKSQEQFEEKNLKTCNNQNLAVCHVFCCLNESPSSQQAQAVLDYITKFMKANNSSCSNQLLKLLRCMLEERAAQWDNSGVNITSLASVVVTYCLKSHGCIDDSPLFNLLCDLSIACVLHPNKSVGKNVYTKFVGELPIILAQENVSAKAMDTIVHLAAFGESGIFLGVKNHLPAIIANLSRIKIVGRTQQEAQTNVMAILYRASEWRADILDSVANQITNNAPPNLQEYFIELLRMKKNNNPGCSLSLKLNSMQWWQALGD